MLLADKKAGDCGCLLTRWLIKRSQILHPVFIQPYTLLTLSVCLPVSARGPLLSRDWSVFVLQRRVLSATRVWLRTSTATTSALLDFYSYLLWLYWRMSLYRKGVYFSVLLVSNLRQIALVGDLGFVCFPQKALRRDGAWSWPREAIRAWGWCLRWMKFLCSVDLQYVCI